MKSSTTNYEAQRTLWITQPQLFLRAYYVRDAGMSEYAFSRDFAMGTVLSPSTPKLDCVKTISGAAQQADPIAGRSSIGFFEAQLGDAPAGNRNVLRQVSDPARLLEDFDVSIGATSIRNSNVVMAATSQNDGNVISVDDVSGYPELGHVTIDDEDFSYTGIDTTANSFVGVRPARRGTVAAAHVIGTVVRNGEQLVRGARLSLFLGYAPLAEADYGPGPGFTKMEIQSVASQDFGMTWTLRCSDQQRFIKRMVFELATEVTPVNLGPINPITLMLQVLTSTGHGTNGSYDVLPETNGAAVPASAIDIAGWEAIRAMSDITSLQFSFSLIRPRDAKDWVETQILRPLAILPFINQAGKYSGRAIQQPTTLTLAQSSSISRGA